MKTLFKRENIKVTIAAIIYLLFGVLFCVMPIRMYNFSETILCAFLLGAGIVCIVIYALLSHEDKPLKLLLYGIIGVVLGVLILMWPRLLGVILSLIIGYSGTMLIVEFIKNKKQGSKTNVTELVIGIIVTLLSVVAIVLSGTNAAKNILSIFFGLICLTQGLFSVAQLVVVLKQEKRSVKDSSEATQEKVESIDDNTQIADDKTEVAEQNSEQTSDIVEVVEEKKESVAEKTQTENEKPKKQMNNLNKLKNKGK